MEYISTALSDSGVVLKIDTSQVKENISKDTDWALHPIWLAYATRLDQSSVMFYLPDLYDALVEITGEDFGYYEAYTSSEEIMLYIVGVYKETQPIGPFWHKDLSLPEKGLTDCATKLLKFGKLAQDELELHHEEWNSSLQDSENYLTTHRRCVRRVGRVLGVDMEDHDLTKCRIVQVALAYMWHWSGDKTMRSESLMQLARDTIKAGHLQRENHHPEYDGEINCEKMFADRVAVHLQKDIADGGNGWLLNPRFIPEQFKVQWDSFKSKHMDLNMYELVWNVL